MKAITTIGSNSLGIYIISGYAFDAIRKKNILMTLGIDNHILLVLMWSAILLVVTYAMTIIIKKTPVLKTLLLGIKP